MAKKPHLKLHNDGSMSYRVDAWANPISGQGMPGIDKSLGQILSPAFSHLLHNNQQVLTNIVVGDPARPDPLRAAPSPRRRPAAATGDNVATVAPSARWAGRTVQNLPLRNCP